MGARTEETEVNSVQSKFVTNHRGACGKKMATWIWRCQQTSILCSNIPGAVTVQWNLCMTDNLKNPSGSYKTKVYTKIGTDGWKNTCSTDEHSAKGNHD